MATATTSEVLAQLRPATKTNIIDLLAAVGHGVSHWSFREDGTPVAEPASNGAYCYDWAFGSEQKGIVLCVWHKSLVATPEHIEYRKPQKVGGRALRNCCKLDPDAYRT
jgi:hypothetical protein